MLSLNILVSTWSSITIFCLIITYFVISFIHYWYRWSHPKCNGKLPPGSMGFPLIGETLQFLIPSKSIDIPRFLKKRIAMYGKLFRTSIAGQQIIVSADQEFNHYVFQQEGKLVQLWYMDSFSAFFGRHIDDTASAYIHKYSKNTILSYIGTESLKEKLLSKIEIMVNQGLESWSTKSSIEVRTSITKMIFDISAKDLFSYDTAMCHEDMSENFGFLQGVMCIPLNIPGTAFHALMKNQKETTSFLRSILQERLKLRENKQQHLGDLLDKLIDDMKVEEFVTENFIVFFMFSVLLASFETISAAVTVAMTFLSDQPLIIKELTEEHEEILRSRENTSSLLTWKEYKSMKFTSQVINETMRMTNLVPGILRKVIKDIHVNGYVIPEGWTLAILPSCVHFNPEKYEDPLAFNPWRWNDAGSSKNFMPFGGGTRNCVGSEYAKVAMAVFFHVLVTKFRWAKIKGGQISRTPVLSFGDGLHMNISKIDEINTNTL
ncbi:hypothetical protein MKX03_010928 [Papaver bracteatum]|nr:hypothetical protein MKX03_010928 [Papaver bracteatum]